MVMDAVRLDEPDGYRGRRRRFRLSQRAGGAALPALLVAASVVVVLIVVGVAQLLPHRAAGQIPIGAGGGTDPRRTGQAQPEPSGTPGASASAQPSRSPSAKPSASASASGATKPATATALPAVPGAPPPFAPVTVEAEAASLGAGARPATCAPCSGGVNVHNIGNNGGFVTFRGVSAPAAGAYQLTITYELGVSTRKFYISVNGGNPMILPLSGTSDWTTPLTFTVPIPLNAGPNSIRFDNPTSSYAPDLDKISIR